MKWTSALAIYALFWAFSVFLALPFGVRSHHEAGEPLVPGQADGAPANFSPLRLVVRTTIIATVLFALYYANYVAGWVTPDALDWLAPSKAS